MAGANGALFPFELRCPRVFFGGWCFNPSTASGFSGNRSPPLYPLPPSLLLFPRFPPAKGPSARSPRRPTRIPPIEHGSSRLIPLLLIVTLLLGSGLAPGAEKPPRNHPTAPGTQRERVSLILVDVVVTDSNGLPVTDL